MAEYIQLKFDFSKCFETKYVPPDYIKFYTIYQYDRNKFKNILRNEVKKNPPKNDDEFKELQKKILEQCYIRDEKGKKKRDTDEKHIFRYMALEKILESLFIKLGPRASDNVCSCFFECGAGAKDKIDEILAKHYDGDVGRSPSGALEIILYPDEKQAEIKGSWKLPVSERVKIHIRLLRKVKCLK